MVDLNRFFGEEIVTCDLSTTEGFEADCLMSELATIDPKNPISRDQYMRGIEKAKALVDSFEGNTGVDMNRVKVWLMSAEVKLQKNFSIDRSLREEVSELLTNASRDTRVLTTFEFAECLLSAEKFRQATGGDRPVVFPGSLGVQPAKL